MQGTGRGTRFRIHFETLRRAVWGLLALVLILGGAFPVLAAPGPSCNFFDKESNFIGSAQVAADKTLEGSYNSSRVSKSSFVKFSGIYSARGLRLSNFRAQGASSLWRFSGEESGCLKRRDCYPTRHSGRAASTSSSCACHPEDKVAKFSTKGLYALCQTVAQAAAPATDPARAPDARGLVEIHSRGDHLTILPVDVVRVQRSARASFTLAPEAGYTLFKGVTGSCPAGRWTSGSTYETGTVEESCSVVFAATPLSFRVSVSTDGNIDAAPGNTQNALFHEVVRLKLVPKRGFSVSRAVRGSCPVGDWVGDVYQTGPITSDCTVIAESVKQAFNVIATGDAHTLIASNANQAPLYNEVATYTVNAAESYKVASVVGGTCPRGSWSAPDRYQTGPITADCAVSFSAESVPAATHGAVLKPTSATVLADGRVIRVTFSAPIPRAYSAPDWQPGASKGLSLKTNSGLILEHIGTYMTTAKLKRVASDPPVEWQADTNLTWSSTFLVTDPSKVIPWDVNNLTLSAGAGLLEDLDGNSTAALNTFAVDNKSIVDANGFTSKSFERGKDGITLYVSSTYGDDSNSLQAAQNPATPLQTPWKAMQLLYSYSGGDYQSKAPANNGSAVRLLRGDTFTNGATILTFGQDKMHPFLLEDYWYNYTGKEVDPGTRPVLHTDFSKPGADRPLGMYLYTGTCQHVVVRNLQLVSNTFQFSLERRDLSMTASDVTLDNVVIANARKPGINKATNEQVVADSDGINVNLISNFTLMRSVVVESPDQGMHGDYMFDNFLVSQNVFDNNNQILPGCATCTITSKGDVLTHNIYLHDPASPVVMWGNEISNASSHGVQARAGGVIAYNHFSSNAIAGFLAESGGSFYKNVVYGGRDTSKTLPRGHGFSMSGDKNLPAVLKNTSFQSLENNIIVHTIGRDALALQTATDGGSVKYGTLRHNTIYDAGPIDLWATKGFTIGVQGGHNIVASLKAWNYSFRQDPSLYPLNWYFTDNNLLPTSSKTVMSNVKGTLNEWRTFSHTDTHSVDMPVSVVNPNASPGTYAEKLGLVGRLPMEGVLSPPASSSDADLLTAGYLNYLRNRPLTGAEASWSPAYDMIEVYRYYASQYKPTNLPVLGTAPFDYYGASDYR